MKAKFNRLCFTGTVPASVFGFALLLAVITGCSDHPQEWQAPMETEPAPPVVPEAPPQPQTPEQTDPPAEQPFDLD